MPTVLKRIALDGLGILLIIIAVPIGWLPGPGGIPLALIGLGLLAKNNQWARDLIDGFEQKLEYYSDKIMDASPRIKLLLDTIALSMMTTAIYIAITTAGLTRTVAIGITTSGLILALLNRKRAVRLAAKLTLKT